MSGIDFINEVKQSYIRRKIAFYGLLSLAFSLVWLAIYFKWQPENSSSFTVLFIWGIGIFFLIWEIQKTRRISPAAIVQHLNRTQPELQESCHLLLTPPENLNLLERLQVQRLAPLLRALDPKKAIAISYNKAWFTLFLSLFLSAVILFLPYFSQEKTTLATTSEQPENQIKTTIKSVARIQSVSIRVIPPAYTHRLAYTLNNLNFKAEEGSRLTWVVRTTGNINNLQLNTAEKSKLTFRKVATKPNTYTTSFTPARSFIYTLDLNAKKSELYAVELLADQNPVISIQKPKPYSEIQFGEPQQVNVEANLSDDYGLQKANLVATIAQGSGESVTFREVPYPLSLNSIKSLKQHSVRKNIDLKALGMTYGDEFYFYLQAWDNHRGYARSETYFVQLEDTTVVTDGAALSLGVSVVPAYFRSQRQLIIDTEKLIQGKKVLTPIVVQERSNNLGADQKILRLRYGKFLGEESETVIGANPAAEHHDDDGHGHSATSKEPNNATELLAPYIHQHDTEEDATYFEPAVKAQLKAALAQMWEAELRLRLSQPEAALPFEYKALRLLKEVQQKSRAYVRKMGFDAPPLKEAEKRLTGELNKINAPDNIENRTEKQSYPFIRQALPWLSAQQPGFIKAGKEILLLQQAGQELAQITVNQPVKYLKSLKSLRQLITEVQTGKITCSPCLVTVAAAFESVLPQPTVPLTPQSVHRSPLAEQYFRNVK
ncbi:hypothetical protein AHMF7605_21335 [Adhaeribacter arboris]|uniref:DUF4175 domain-containing protein n=1 Tax=Adhaeribacter arboris TaxID=2072846 RepID=A0A2T2YK24_9BACT|nr:DUF4175 family protein [Adhaeribacter arboris]PSR55861.1 hypothetical protein AHMF7605_21335 [Adhaeribacter arboris]